MIPLPISALANHLWQSTLFTGAMWVLALALRKNSAAVRYSLWMAASVKFLIPFALLVSVGSHFGWRTAPRIAQAPAAQVVEEIGQPFRVPAVESRPAFSDSASSSSTSFSVPAPPPARSRMPEALIGLWLCGFAVGIASWLRWMLRMRAMRREGTPVMVKDVPIPVLSSRRKMEPCVFGIFRPVLLLPEGIVARLTASELDAIVAHELSHVRRRDSLTAAIHMCVETIFWFYPLLRWVRVRLIEERERACDEAVLQMGNQPEVYAESILKVCKFYLASPPQVAAGVTGFNLKRRIEVIVDYHGTAKLGVGRKLLLVVAGSTAVATPVMVGAIHQSAVLAQAAVTPANPRDLTGMWQGTLQTDKGFRIVVKMTKADKGWQTNMYSIDEGTDLRGIGMASLEGSSVRYEISTIGGVYAGKLSADGASMTGNWAMPGNAPLALTLMRATDSTAWEIPAPALPQKPMAADADPSFDVVTIKPNDTGEIRGLYVNGRHVTMYAASLGELIAFAYGIQEKQIFSEPGWMDKNRYDIDGVPDKDGIPNVNQLRSMMQKLLADRFQLKFHYEKRELSVYALVVGKGGPKNLTPSTSPNPLPGLGFMRAPNGMTSIARNATIAEYAKNLQGGFLDRPVVDQTGITGKYDFRVTFTPDDSMFGGHAPLPIPKSDDPAASFFTAIQAQLGLKLDAVKAPADVIVIDHAEKPSAN